MALGAPINQSLPNALRLLGHAASGQPLVLDSAHRLDPPGWLLRPAKTVVVVSFGLGLTALLARGSALAHGAAFALALLFVLLVAPYAALHHFILAAPAALLVPLWLLAEGRRHAAWAMAATCALLPWANQTGGSRLGLLGLGLSAWLVVACALAVSGMWRVRCPRSPDGQVL